MVHSVGFLKMGPVFACITHKRLQQFLKAVEMLKNSNVLHKVVVV
jgi:hypothetical protein